MKENILDNDTTTYYASAKAATCIASSFHFSNNKVDNDQSEDKSHSSRGRKTTRQKRADDQVIVRNLFTLLVKKINDSAMKYLISLVVQFCMHLYCLQLKVD